MVVVVACLIVVVVMSAFPTAYSGASGIFVIAAGALIFQEMMRSGARKQLAIATTAMAGSMGVVLRPCLLVVIVASLNKQVTTDELFTWGIKVYLLSAFLFLGGLLITRREPVTGCPERRTAALYAPWRAGVRLCYGRAGRRRHPHCTCRVATALAPADVAPG